MKSEEGEIRDMLNDAAEEAKSLGREAAEADKAWARAHGLDEAEGVFGPHYGQSSIEVERLTQRVARQLGIRTGRFFSLHIPGKPDWHEKVFRKKN